MLRGARGDVWPQDVEPVEIPQKRIFVEARYLPRRPILALGGLHHLVLAGVPVRGHVSDIRDVHHVLDRPSTPQQDASKEILEQIRAKIADMSVIVNGRSAAVHAHQRAGCGLEPLLRAR